MISSAASKPGASLVAPAIGSTVPPAATAPLTTDTRGKSGAARTVLLLDVRVGALRKAYGTIRSDDHASRFVMAAARERGSEC